MKITRGSCKAPANVDLSAFSLVYQRQTERAAENPRQRIIESGGAWKWLDDDGLYHRDGAPAIIYPDGSEHWYQHGKLDRKDGPAITKNKGAQLLWYQNGQRHRIDGPAIVDNDKGFEAWYQHDKYHRVGGPAITREDGSEAWYQNGLRHRLDGPAIVYASGEKRWWRNNLRHCSNGPAVIRPDGSKEYYLDDVQYTEEEFFAFNVGVVSDVISDAEAEIHPVIDDLYVYKPSSKIPIVGSISSVYKAKTEDGVYLTQRYFVIRWGNKRYGTHRLEAPAVENADGSSERWQNDKFVSAREPQQNNFDSNPEYYYTINSAGDKEFFCGKLRHRVGGPAIEWADGGKTYCENGVFHRLDGPAIVTKDLEVWYEYGNLIRSKDGPVTAWYKNNLFHRDDAPAVTAYETEYWYQNGKLHRVGAPAVTRLGDEESWYRNGVLHRIDGPAVTTSFGTKNWYQNGLTHRIDGPAITYADGGYEYWVNGTRHRMDGPALYYSSKSPINAAQYFVNGHRIDEKTFYKKFCPETKGRFRRKKAIPSYNSESTPVVHVSADEEAMLKMETLMKFYEDTSCDELPDGHFLKL